MDSQETSYFSYTFFFLFILRAVGWRDGRSASEQEIRGTFAGTKYHICGAVVANWDISGEISSNAGAAIAHQLALSEGAVVLLYLAN